MKRLFLLIPVLALSLLANAKEIEIGSSTSNIIHYTIAASSTSDGDVIVLTDAGPYVNSKANSDDYTKISKNVTIKAASGIHPVIKFEVPIQARDGKSGKFIGIKFDGSSLQYDHFIYFKDGNDNELEFEDCEFYNSSKFIVNVPSSTKAKSLVFRNCKFYDNTTNRGILNQGNIGHLGVYGCEFSGFVKDVIDGYTGTSHVDSCIVKNSYFHNHSRGSIFFEASTVDGTQTCDKLIVKNSTFANINGSGDYHSVIDIRPYSSTNTIKVEVDHCTFYNNTVINSDHANIRTANISDVTVSNCIFAYPSAYATRATYCTGGGNINNCLTYNYTADGTKGHAYGCTVNAASSVGNPLFNDLANNKYTYAGNWVTMNISPARGTATDGSDLGDPRWYSDEVLPETDFATPYVFAPAKAKLNGRVSVSESNLLWNNNQDASLNGSATWKIHATRTCYLSATINNNASNTGGHCFSIQVLDADGNAVGDPLAEPANSWSHSDDVLSGQIYLPVAGDYTVVLSNSTEWSEALLSSITFSYIGGAVQNLPGTTNIADALFSAEGTRADGKIDFPDGSIQDGWVKWNVAFASSVSCNVTVNIDNANGHNYTVALYRSESDESPITIGEGGKKYTSGTPNAIALGEMSVPAGNYILKVTNAVQYSDAKLISVTFAYAGGAAQNIPCAITLSDAILSSRAYIDGSGYLHFTDADHLGTISGEWAKWNIHAASEGVYTFTAHCRSTNWSNLTFKVLDTDENELYSYTPEWTYQSDDKTITSPEWILAAGDYVLRLSNPADGSDGYLISLAAAKSDIIVLDENATSASVIHDNNGVSDKKIALMRSFKADMYNTICLPFEDWDSSLKLIFGTGYSLLRLKTATIDGDVLDLEFESVTTLGHGRPYLIKPTKDVTNPIFGTGHTIDERTSGYSTTVCDNADFIGNFIKTTISANEDNLFLGSGNQLQFSDNDVTIKGMRAYFGVKNPSGAPIRKARIVEKDNIVTELELIDGEWQDIKAANGTIKTIENGQLILIRDGKRYNVMGIRF